MEWDLTTEEGLAAFYDASFDAAYRCAVRLTGGRRAEAEDVVHDAYATVLSSIDRGTLVHAGVGLMVTAVRRRFLNSRRGAERERRRLRLAYSPGVVIDPPVDEGGVDLSGLSDRERAALVFRYVDDLPVGEVAGLLGSSVRATESLLQRAKRKARTAEEES